MRTALFPLKSLFYDSVGVKYQKEKFEKLDHDPDTRMKP